MATTKYIDRGYYAIKKQLEIANTKTVSVGVLNGSEAHGDVTVGEIATWNHYGTANIPARPFIVGPIDAKQAELQNLVKRLTAGISTGKIDTEFALNVLGQKLRDTCVSAINNREFEPNADSTIAKKGSSTPLVDTGQLKGAIAFEIVDAGDK